MSINLTDEIEVKTKKGKLGAAKQIFLEGDTQTVENEIQDINSRHNDLNSKHESLSSTVSEHTNQIESNQNQITANKSTQDAKNASLDANMAKLNTRDDQITELVRGITATGGASVATTVTYDNTSSHLTSATVQGAIDELQGSKIDKTSILQELGNAEDKVMSQKSVSDAIATEETRAREVEENLVGKVTDLEEKTDGISLEDTLSADESIVIEDNNGNKIAEIDSNGADFKHLKSNGAVVLTEENGATKEYIDNKTNSIEHEESADNEEYVSIESNERKEYSRISIEDEDEYNEEQRWESNDKSEVYAKVNKDGIDGKISVKIPNISIPALVEPDDSIVDTGYSSPIGRDNVIRENWTASDKYLYYQFIAHYYDVFIGKTSNYKVTKRSLGNDCSKAGYEIFEFDFCPANYKKVVLLSAGMNSCETGAIWGLATFMKSVMTSSVDSFKFLKENVRFKVIPIICPYSFDQSTLLYANKNGAGINRNFNYLDSWYNLDTYGKTLRGAYPDSENESLVLKKWLNDNAWKADLYIDCHQDPDKNISQENVLSLVIISDSTTKNKLDRVKTILTNFYRAKGYIPDDVNPTLAYYTEGGTNYPKTLYSKMICGIPALMIEQYCSSKMWGSDGNTINDSYGIKNYVTLLHLYIYAVLAGNADTLFVGNLTSLLYQK